MKEHIVLDWNDFERLIFRDDWNSSIQRHRTNYVFRGLSNSSYDLLPSLNRVCKSKLYLEKSLLRNFKKYASSEIPNKDNFWEVLSIAQHHGLPTRLLDWTFSPYVALHFATENFEHYDKDGAIWCVDFVGCHKFLPEVLKDSLNINDANGFSVDMLNDVVPDFSFLEFLEEGYGEYVLFFEPSSIDSRIINQYALFSIMSSKEKSIMDWLEKHDDLCIKIIIPSKLKLEFSDRLEQINMTERIIYPGLDGLCKWLTRHYTPTEAIKGQ